MPQPIGPLLGAEVVALQLEGHDVGVAPVRVKEDERVVPVHLLALEAFPDARNVLRILRPGKGHRRRRRRRQSRSRRHPPFALAEALVAIRNDGRVRLHVAALFRVSAVNGYRHGGHDQTSKPSSSCRFSCAWILAARWLTAPGVIPALRAISFLGKIGLPYKPSVCSMMSWSIGPKS